MFWAVDILAHEYGWSKNEILNNVYLDELFELVKKINKRKLSEYQIQLAIVQNPFVKNPKELWETIKREATNYDTETEPVYDKTGLELLKMKLSNGSKIVIK